MHLEFITSLMTCVENPLEPQIIINMCEKKMTELLGKELIR
jgi:hypothetical protein